MTTAIIPLILFYLSAGAVAYVYAGYPLLLLVWRGWARRPTRKTPYEPSVSIIVAAYNESATIERRIVNLLSLDYPAAKTQIILVLDGPTDGGELVARKHETDRMQVLLLKQHVGKAEALNRAVAEATGTILVFADARPMLDRTAVRELAGNFEDGSVGAVSGELVLLDGSGKEAGCAVGLYWRYEKALRSMESDIHSTIGATGALYAIRRDLYWPIPSHTILDDVAIPMNAVLHGKRVLFDRSARAYDYVERPSATEFTRKARTLAGNFQLLKQMPALLSPWRNPVFAQFVSHKVGRLLAPYFLLLLFVSNCLLTGNAYRALLLLQCVWYSLACGGALLAQRQTAGEEGWMKRLMLFPYTFVLMNWAAVVGLSRFIRSRRDVWAGYNDVESTPTALNLHKQPNRHESKLPEGA